MTRGGAVRTVPYGQHPAQACDLHAPRDGGRGVAVLLHGGYWRARYDRSLQDDVARDLVRRGWWVWNVDYRGVGAGGGWPATFEDVAAALDLLPRIGPELGVPMDRLVVVGHSAGGTLALWGAARGRLPDGAPGAGPPGTDLPVPRAVVAQAGVCDLVAGARAGIGAGAVRDLMGRMPPEPDDVPPAAAPDPYVLASPMARLPLGVPTLLVTGADDDTVPPSQSTSYAAAARAAGDPVTLAVLPGEGHYGHLDPGSPVWRVTADWLAGV